RSRAGRGARPRAARPRRLSAGRGSKRERGARRPAPGRARAPSPEPAPDTPGRLRRDAAGLAAGGLANGRGRMARGARSGTMGPLASPEPRGRRAPAPARSARIPSRRRAPAARRAARALLAAPGLVVPAAAASAASAPEPDPVLRAQAETLAAEGRCAAALDALAELGEAARHDADLLALGGACALQ